MVFPDHKRQKAKLAEDYSRLEKLLDEKQEIFDRTQPGSGGSEVKSSPRNDKLDAYLIASEIISKRIEESWAVIAEREKLLHLTTLALAASPAQADMVYYRFVVQGKTIKQIAAEMHYTERQIRRLLRVSCPHMS